LTLSDTVLRTNVRRTNLLFTDVKNEARDITRQLGFRTPRISSEQ